MHCRVAAPILALLAGPCLLWNCAADGGRGRVDSSAAPATGGAALYARHCGACHGEDGGADTPAAALLRPAPRPFREGVFQLASTHNGVPTEDDLVRTLRRGLPGSAMPGYGWLPEQDLHSLARHVRELARTGMERTIAESARLTGVRLEPEQARRQAEERLRPGVPIALPPAVTMDDKMLAAGQRLYVRHCAACHGADGKGRGPAAGWAGAADHPWARDFTAGYLRAAPTAAELTWRIRGGMPAAHMPPTDLTDAEAALLVGFVQSLIPDGADLHHAQWRRHVTAVHVEQLPTTADDPGWETIEAVRLPVAPLWWRRDAVHEVWLRAAHDGSELRLQLRWRDATRDDRLGQGLFQGDGAAVQWTAATDAPFFAMGGHETVEIWRWKAWHRAEVAGVLDLLDNPLHQGLDAPPPLPGVTQPQRTGESVAVAGAEGMSRERGQGRAIAAMPLWRDGEWSLVLGRKLAAATEREVPLTWGQPVLFGLAVWNGSVDPNAASKSVATWHELSIEPRR